MQANRLSRMTSQRRTILEELQAAPSHPTADEVYQRVRRRLPRISLGTVYRNLETLAARGLIRKLDVPGGQRRFDCNPEFHYHVRCTKCGAVKDVSLKIPISMDGLLEDAGGYELSGVTVEFLGVCPRCGNR